ncbi:MAG: phosphate regulon sensor histidine kinase PhoR [Gammaproteobacteria bacterium]|nr:phosphate regulon sensor histidine kinase PhoR [Gammaproteobacteria bacterium]
MPILIGLLVSLVIFMGFLLMKRRHSPSIESITALSPTDQRNHSDSAIEEDFSRDLHESIAALPDAVIVLRANFEIEWGNDTALQWFNIITRPVEGQQFLTSVENDELSEHISQRKYNSFFDCQAPGEEKISLRIRIVPYRDGMCLLQARDITRIKQLEQIRRDFVSNASHELRTPLSLLHGYLEMMQEDGGQTIDASWSTAIDQMCSQTKRMKQIVDDMMILSRLEETELSSNHQYFDMAGTLESHCGHATMINALKSHTFVVRIEPGYLYGNVQEVESLITNLLSNAVRYTPNKGKITVEWEVDLAGATLSVIDTGIGIEAQEIPRITERFYRTDPARSKDTGGTGLGLAIVNHIAMRHDATLTINSKVGKGSRFSVHFPLSRIRRDNDQVTLLLH